MHSSLAISSASSIIIRTRVAGTSVSIGANGRLLVLMLVLLLSSLVVPVLSSGSLEAAADWGHVTNEIAGKSDASINTLRSSIGGASLAGDGNAPSDDVVGTCMHSTLLTSNTFLVRLELRDGRWRKASAHGIKQGDGPDNARTDDVTRIYLIRRLLSHGLLPSKGSNGKPQTQPAQPPRSRCVEKKTAKWVDHHRLTRPKLCRDLAPCSFFQGSIMHSKTMMTKGENGSGALVADSMANPRKEVSDVRNREG